MFSEITIYFFEWYFFFLGLLYFIYPKNAISLFLMLSLILPTSNQFMNFTFSGIYFYDFFFLLFSFYYLIFLIKEKKIFKKKYY